jgi:hypothetical protein
MGLHEIKKLLYNKRIALKIEKAIYRMGEKSLPATHQTRD